MVTIEQKLTLFSKLLHQDIKEEMDKKLTDLDKAYAKLIAKDKEKADREAKLIIDSAIKRAEAKKVEMISKSKMAAKRECMLAREKYIDLFMMHLKDKITTFTDTDAYKSFLGSCMGQFETLKDWGSDLMIYVTEKDYQRHLNYIEEKLISLGLEKQKLNFKITDDSILGGLIIEDSSQIMRIDSSISALLEESRNSIIESVFKAIGEAGEALE